MANLFNSIRIRPPRYNRFDLSHDVKLTAKFGKLIPILVRPTLPGDVYKLNTEVLVRMAPMFAPIMTKVNVYTHYFFVPNRLLWDGWKDFITGGENGEGSGEIYPRYKVSLRSQFPDDIELMGYTGSLADYLNFPVLDKMPNQDRTAVYDALPFRAYNLIWNEYYRDENLQEELIIGKDKGGIIDTTTMSGQTKYDIFALKNRAWKKDYFTSALPFAQRGDEVELPIQGDAPIITEQGKTYVSVSPLNSVRPITPPFTAEDGSLQYAKFGAVGAGLTTPNGQAVEISTHEKSAVRAPYISLDGLRADLSKASSATINELRRAIKAQEFLELAARGGSRYIEQIYSYFGVRSSDARLQRPEFLGGGKSPVMISDVLQTSQSTADSAQASPAGHGVSVQRSHSFKFRCEEHGYIIGIMSIMPEASYMQGMPRLYQKFDRLDYYWPQFAHLGEQEIKQGELFYDFNDANDVNNSKTFGYTPRYAEYKQMLSSIHGDFRSSLSFWHMGRIFALPPALNEAFISNVEDAANRVFNVKDKGVDKLWINIHHNFKALMKMPKYGTPLL